MSTDKNTSAYWREHVGAIEGLVSTAQATLKHCDEDRAKYALGAATGDKSALKEIERVRDAQKSATEALADHGIALQQARQLLAQAEHHEFLERQTAAAVKAKALVAERIEAAKRFDEAAAALDEAYTAYKAKGDEITRLGDLNLFAGRSDNISAYEATFGTMRVKAALPATIGRLLTTFLLPDHRKLEESEIGQWRGVL